MSPRHRRNSWNQSLARWCGVPCSIRCRTACIPRSCIPRSARMMDRFQRRRRLPLRLQPPRRPRCLRHSPLRLNLSRFLRGRFPVRARPSVRPIRLKLPLGSQLIQVGSPPRRRNHRRRRGGVMRRGGRSSFRLAWERPLARMAISRECRANRRWSRRSCPLPRPRLPQWALWVFPTLLSRCGWFLRNASSRRASSTHCRRLPHRRVEQSGTHFERCCHRSSSCPYSVEPHLLDGSS